MIVLGIDPGTTQSGWARYDVQRSVVLDAGIGANANIVWGIAGLRPEFSADVLAMEQFEPRGMPLGLDSLETVYWSGRIAQSWGRDNTLHRIFRRAVKAHLCGSAKAKDGNIRQALIDLIGAQGSKRDPGPTYGVVSHAWAALAVAVTCADTLRVSKAAA